MGPRSHERGNLIRTPRTRKVWCASMGPRSHERGNSVTPFVTEAEKLLGFNGAAFS